MPHDVLFPECWPEINVADYVSQHKLDFDRVDLRTIPHYLLIKKIKLGGMLVALLVNDPQKHDSKHRDRLNTAVLKEMRRQLTLLVGEYNWRIKAKLIAIETQPKIFLSRFVDKPEAPEPVVVNMRPAVIRSRRG